MQRLPLHCLAGVLALSSATLHAQWRPVQSGTNASLRGLSVVNSRVVWASGARGIVTRTADGGATWKVDSIPGATRMDLRAIHGRGDRIAHVAATAGRIWRTVDGGKTWSLRYHATDTTVFLDAIDFWDGDHGIVLGDPMNGRWFVLTTSDGGNTWKELPFAQRPVALPGEAAFAASGSSLVTYESQRVWIGSGGKVARVFRSDDRGQTWRVFDAPILAGEASQGIFSLAVDGSHVYAVGGDYQKPTITRSIAATLYAEPGPIWTPARQTLGGYRSGVALWGRGDRHVLIATGPDGSDISLDHGLTWARFDSVGFHAVRASRDGLFAASGSDGRLALFDARTIK